MKSVLLLFLSSWFASDTATQFVDDIEPLLRMNRDNYLSGPRTAVRQAQALAYFDQQWMWLKSSQACGSRMLGSAGTRCIQERERNGLYPWLAWYRDPIESGRQ